MTYERFAEACNRGSACPKCFTTCSAFVKKVADRTQPAFACLLCDHRFNGHEYVDHAKVAA